MPPKKAAGGAVSKSKKVKSDASTEAVNDTPGPTQPSKKTMPKKVLKLLLKDTAMPMPIDVTYEGNEVATKSGKSKDYCHSIKLQAPDQFTLHKTVMLPEGSPYGGYQAILMIPARGFPFMKLAEEVRVCIYRQYFAPEADEHGNVLDHILIDAKRGSNKQAYAKQFAHGSKNRVALLATNKTIYEGAAPILYDQTFRFESTTHLLDFMSSLPAAHRNKMKEIEIHNYLRSAGRMALNQLIDSQSLTRLSIELNLTCEQDIVKAAKAFWLDAMRFLESMSTIKGGKEEGFAVLDFGKHALCFKTNENKLRPWSAPMIDEFKTTLKGKMK